MKSKIKKSECSVANTQILRPEQFRHYVETFNRQDEELYPQYIPNSEAWEFLSENIPLFECPDKELELTYYFRWWTYRKHIKKSPEGFVITEFLPAVPWAGKHNTVNLTAGIHFNEGRWLKDSKFLDAYSRFWFRHGGTTSGQLAYTCWFAHALCERAKVSGDFSIPLALLDDLVSNYRAWEQGWDKDGYGATRGQKFHVGKHENHLFFQMDMMEGSEYTISGPGYRPFTNSAMFGEAMAIASLAKRVGRDDLAEIFEKEAHDLKSQVQNQLWNPELNFFCTLNQDKSLVNARELWGYIPWYFHLPDPGYEAGWRELRDPQGFLVPYGPTFAEQRHPDFRLSYEGHECLWNGPSWPLATSMTLTALANLLNGPTESGIGKRNYFDTLMCYARSHRRVKNDGTIVPWIDENLHPYTGDWIARTRLEKWDNGTWSQAKGGKERGKDYNHSTFCDLIITGLCGLRPRADELIEVNPLLPENTWEYFCLDRIPYHGNLLTILWDRNGKRYGAGSGLRVLCNGIEIGYSERIGRI